MGDNTCFLSNISSALYIDKKRWSIGISCQVPLSIWVLMLMLVIIIIVISPLVNFFSCIGGGMFTGPWKHKKVN